MTKIMYVASTGGHLVQLKRIAKYLDYSNSFFVSTKPDNSILTKQYTVSDCSFDRKLLLIRCFLQLVLIILKERPTTIVSTGAAPGFLSILIGFFFKKNTIWIDSIANAECMSMSGRYASKLATTCCSQWEHVAKNNNVLYLGKVL